MRHRILPLLLLLAPAGALAQAPSKVLVATAKEVLTDVVTPGTIVCVGGAPTNNPQGPPCSPGTRQVLISYRNTLAQYQEVTGSAAALIRGQVNVVVHCNLDGNYYGHCWGHFRVDRSRSRGTMGRYLGRTARYAY